jgi:hypothetical protein
MSFERDGVIFRFTSEEAEAERQKLITEEVLPAAREYFAREADVTHVSCFVAQYWNDEGLDDLYVRALPSKEGAESPDEVEAAIIAAEDLQSLFAAYCEYGDPNDDDSKNYRLFVTISRTGVVTWEKQVRPWLDGVQCLYEPDTDPSGKEEAQFEVQLAFDSRRAVSGFEAQPPSGPQRGPLSWLKNILKR